MDNKFEIIDDTGVIESPLDSFEDAMAKLDELIESEFEFNGDIKIVEVHYITR